MKTTIVLLIHLTWAHCAGAVTVIVPEYHNDRINQTALGIWRQLIEDAGVLVNAGVTIPVGEISDNLTTYAAEPAVTEIAVQFFAEALDKGWRPLARFERSLQISLFTRGELKGPLRSVGSPPDQTAVSLYLHKLTDLSPIQFESHSHCMRAMVTGEVQACATTQPIGVEYAKRFGLDDVGIFGDSFTVPPSVMIASKKVSDEVFLNLSQQTFDFTELNATYIPFEPERDWPLYSDVLP